MNKQALVEASRVRLRLSIACTLKIPYDDYIKSTDLQSSVNRLLTNIMHLGYHDNFKEALEEALECRFFGGSPSAKEFDDFVDELRATASTFEKEVSAYRSIHQQYNEGVSPSSILEHFISMTPLTSEYESA